MADYEVSEADIARVEKVLQDDIRWAIESGPGWDPLAGAERSDDEGPWIPLESSLGGPCGVCAIGAFVLRHQPPGCDDQEAAAEALGVPEEFMAGVYVGVARRPGERHFIEPGWQLGYRLRDFADALVAEKAVSK